VLDLAVFSDLDYNSRSFNTHGERGRSFKDPMGNIAFADFEVDGVDCGVGYFDEDCVIREFWDVELSED